MADKKRVQEAYDAIAAEYDAATDEAGIDERQRTVIARFVDHVAGGTVLDAGCGGEPLTDEAVTVVGLDFSREQLARVTETPVVQGDMTRLPFAANTFHGVTAFFSMIHIPLDERETTYAELARVLQPNGILLFTEGPDEWVGAEDDWLGAGAEMQWEIAGQSATEAHLNAAGFEILDVVPVTDSLGDNEGEKLFFLARNKA